MPEAHEREQEVLHSTVRILATRLQPKRILLFGSRSKGNNQHGADFDIAVEAARPPITQEREMLEEVENAAGLYKVDIVYLSTVDKDFRDIITRTGKVLYER